MGCSNAGIVMYVVDIAMPDSLYLLASVLIFVCMSVCRKDGMQSFAVNEWAFCRKRASGLTGEKQECGDGHEMQKWHQHLSNEDGPFEIESPHAIDQKIPLSIIVQSKGRKEEAAGRKV